LITSITYDAEGVKLASNYYLIARGFPERLQNEDLLIKAAEGFSVYHEQKGKYLRLGLFILPDFFNQKLMMCHDRLI
jgi:hypothetical protein